MTEYPATRGANDARVLRGFAPACAQSAVVMESPVMPAARRAASLRFCGSIV
jgi:hypothetical protein